MVGSSGYSICSRRAISSGDHQVSSHDSTSEVSSPATSLGVFGRRALPCAPWWAWTDAHWGLPRRPIAPLRDVSSTWHVLHDRTRIATSARTTSNCAATGPGRQRYRIRELEQLASASPRPRHLSPTDHGGIGPDGLTAGSAQTSVRGEHVTLQGGSKTEWKRPARSCGIVLQPAEQTL